MPRGIPKDPNHPKNQKKQAVADADSAPKRRGRPPGSKNAKNTKAETAEPVLKKAKATTKAEVPGIAHGVAQTNNIDKVYKQMASQAELAVVRENITALAQAVAALNGNPGGAWNVQSALDEQVQRLQSMTKALFDGSTETIVTPEPVQVATPAPVAPVPVTQTVATPPLPAPPNFMPPPFPPTVAQ